MRENGSRSPVWSLMGLIPVELDGLTQFEFTRTDIHGVEALIGRLGEQNMLLGSRIPDTAIPPAWQQRVGRYRLINQGDDSIAISDIQIQLEDHRLILSFTDPDAGDHPKNSICVHCLTPVRKCCNPSLEPALGFRWCMQPGKSSFHSADFG